MSVPQKCSSSVGTITTFFSESESDPSVEIERFRRKFKLMRAHLLRKVLGTSSPSDVRLTVLVADIVSLSANGFLSTGNSEITPLFLYLPFNSKAQL